MNLDALDRWITSGRYSFSWGWVTCAGCGERTLVKTETEYGCTTWSPEECASCGTAFEGDEDWENDEPEVSD